MKNTFNLFLIICAVIIFVLGCGSTSKQNNSANDLTVSAPEAGTSEKIIKFGVQDNITIKATVVEKEGVQLKLATFEPSIKRNDGNLYMTAINLLKTLDGQNRGSSEEATIKPLGNDKYACWQITNPSQNFCVAPIAKSDTDQRIAAVSFFVE